MKTVLITGGAGYIGSHTAVELLNAGYGVIVVDNFTNSEWYVIERIQKITGKAFPVYESDVADKKALTQIFRENVIDAVVHFAGYKSIKESVEEPVAYYRNNLDSTLSLLEVMKEFQVRNLIFSSSATVYGEEAKSPCREDFPTGGCTNPYGWTKYMIEQILKDVAVSDPDFSVISLRYFNPVGAHESGLIGEAPKGVPNNLMPYISQVAAGKFEKLSIFGDDYPTPDGTGVRDYVHVVDLARGHVAAVQHITKNQGFDAVNLGSGVGYSVLEMVNAFSKVNGITIPYVIAPRRPGDIAALYSDTQKAETKLGWRAVHSLEDMCRDAWRWEQMKMNSGM